MININTIDIFQSLMQGQDSWKNSKGQPDTSTKFTPQAIAKEMLDMLDGTEQENYLDKIDIDKNTKILNINCKTGIFLIHAIDKLDKALLERADHGEIGYEEFKDSSYRKQYIINNQIYGLALNDTDALLFQSRNVYGCINHPHMTYIKELYAGLRDINKKKQSESIEKTWIEKVRTEIDKAFGNKSAGSERQEHMDFDIVVGNPPYNDDLYLSFVTLGHAISTKCSIWITPAKWQGKSDDCGKNMKFRRDIVPYMSKIISYRDTHDIFDIDYNDGISIYQIRKRKCHIKKIAGHCSKNSQFEYSYEDHDEQIPVLLKRDLLQIIGKVGTLGEGFSQSYYVKNTDSGEPVIAGTLGFRRQTYIGEQDRGEPVIAGTLGFRHQTYIEEQDRGADKALNQRYVLSIYDKAYDVKPLDLRYVEVVQGEKGVCGFKKVDDLRSVNNLDKYKVIMSCMLGGAVIFSRSKKDQAYKVIGSAKYSIAGPYQVPKGSFPVVKYFDTELEAKSFISYIQSELCSFLFFCGVVGATVTREFYRFIPDPGKFDHIYTDDELYRKYKITDDERAMIEAIIKPRNE